MDILNWRILDTNITTSGQFTFDQLRVLKETGTTVVINLGPHEHEDALEDEPHLIETLGMKYVYIPVDFNGPTLRNFDDFVSALQKHRDQQVHVHCIFNARVTAFLYKYACEHEPELKKIARDMMETVWRPGIVWAEFIGDYGRVEKVHEYKGRDY